MNKYQEALDSVRKEVKATFFDEYGKQWWTTNRDDDYRCNLLQEAIDKANKYDEKETAKKVKRIYPAFGDNMPIKKQPKIWGCPICENEIKKHYKYCPNCGQKLKWESDE
jgi:hypothetical protein